MFSNAIPIIAAAAAIGAAAVPIANTPSEPGSISTRSPQNPGTPGYKLVLTQIDETGGESSMNEMFISFPESASESYSEPYVNLKRSRTAAVCIVM